MAPKALTFADRVQALPPELFEEIYALSITNPYPNGTRIDAANYKPLFQLQLDHRLREQCAADFYREITFILPPGLTGMKLVTRWLNCLPNHHCDLIKHIRLESDLVLDVEWFSREQTQQDLREWHSDGGRHLVAIYVTSVTDNRTLKGLETISGNFFTWDSAGNGMENWVIFRAPLFERGRYVIRRTA